VRCRVPGYVGTVDYSEKLMASLEQALELAAKGFHVFPLIQNSKLPAIDGWQTKATTDAEKIRRWWLDPVMGLDQDWNIGICTTRFNCAEALLAVDVDNKNGKSGDAEIIRLELEGNEFAPTREHTTPTGGRHLLYRVEKPVPNSASKLAPGLDIRSSGGFVVAPGSTIDGREYRGTDDEIAAAPQWLVSRLGTASQPAVRNEVLTGGLADEERAIARAVEYLKTAPVAIEGEGGDHTTFKVACKLKDFGVSEDEALGLLYQHWNERCDPPWSDGDLFSKVANAYRYGKEPQGSKAPEAEFPAIPVSGNEKKEDGGSNHPLAKMNERYAFIHAGCYILCESTNENGEYVNYHMSPTGLHQYYANMPFMSGSKSAPLSKAWLEWPQRRSYESVIFSPEQLHDPKFFNMWRGFRVKPAESPDHPSVDAFLEHALKNVCAGDHALFTWLMGYFAHLIQRPYEKPLTALVFKGKKGTGKNALVERVGYLLGGHFIVADDSRYLLGNFNSHLESCLFIALDEAQWAGDKRAEGRLKGIITGGFHIIERKGEEPYKVRNLTRVAILGNEDWLAPATEDERRYAVFEVGDGRKQDRQFFKDMREGMEAGGYANLLRYFLDFDLGQVDVDQAPNTKGLAEQKVQSLELFEQWWLDCLAEGRIVGSDFSEGWPESIPTKALVRAFQRTMRERNVKSRLPDDRVIGKRLSKIAPGAQKHKARGLTEGTYEYLMGALADRRGEFDKFIGQEREWD